MLRHVRKPKKAASQKCEVAFYGNWKVMRGSLRMTAENRVERPEWALAHKSRPLF